MGFQRDHQLMPVRIIDHLIHQLFSKTVMLHLRRHCQIDHMKPFCCMKLGSPAGIQIVFSLDEFPQGRKTWILFDQIAICFQKGKKIHHQIM